MRRLQPVIWSKGTFLTPQHLQAQDRYLESSLEFRLDAVSFNPWGFLRLRLDQEALAAGNLAIVEASGIFPDGLAFDIPETDPAPLPKPIAHFLEGDDKEADFYLAVPPIRAHGINVTSSTGKVDARYLAEVMMMRDETTGESEKPLQVARKNFRLLAEAEVRQGTPALRIAKILRTDSGLLQMDAQFAPPLLDFTASDYVTGISRRLVELLAAKSGQLAGTRRQKNQSLVEFTASDIAGFWLLYTINTHLPLVRHLFEVRHGHPESLFSAMSALAGALTTFSSEIAPRDLPQYTHDDPGKCFGDLDQKLRRLLETVVPSNFVALPLRLVEPSIYATALDDDKYLTGTKLYLAVRADTGEAELINKVPQLVKVCSASHIEHLVSHALPGVTLTHVAQPPSPIPVKLNFQYFSLNQGGLAWEAIERARNLAAYVPGELPNPELELIILLPRAR